MPAPFDEILQQERARLLRVAASPCADSTSPDNLAEVFAIADRLRQSIAAALRQCVGLLSADELIRLQDALHALANQQIKTAVEKQFAQTVSSLTRWAERDALTQLPNRAAFERRLRDEEMRARRYKREFSIIIFDLDDFKSVNDRFGHPAGDRLLAGVARLMQSSLRQSDVVFRYGGDEFIALCPETSSLAMQPLLRRLENYLLAYHPVEGLVINGLAGGVGVSWGAAAFPADAVEIDKLIELADRRLYACKKERRQRVRGAP